MKEKTIIAIIWMAGLLLITSCSGSGAAGSTSTPDPMLMDVYERTIWDFENLRNEMNDLAALAADSPVEDLETIVRQMTELTEEIKGYDYPLSAAKAHSALDTFAWNTEQCYFGKYMENFLKDSDQEPMGDYDERCYQAQVHEETLDLYLLELKEMNLE